MEKANGTFIQSSAKRPLPTLALNTLPWRRSPRISYQLPPGNRATPFKALYDQDTDVPLRVLSIISSLGPCAAEANMRLISEKLFFLQALPVTPS